MSPCERYDRPEHRPLMRVPKPLIAVMAAAARPGGSWIAAGRATAEFLRQRWSYRRPIDLMVRPMQDIILAVPDHGDIGYRLACLLWLYARLPGVIAHIPQEHLIEFNEGVYRNIFLDVDVPDPDIRTGIPFAAFVASGMKAETRSAS